MFYYLVRYQTKRGANGVLNSVFKSVSEAYDYIEVLRKMDVEYGDADDWRYTVEAVETVAEYPAPERQVQV